MLKLLFSYLSNIRDFRNFNFSMTAPWKVVFKKHAFITFSMKMHSFYRIVQLLLTEAEHLWFSETWTALESWQKEVSKCTQPMCVSIFCADFMMELWHQNFSMSLNHDSTSRHGTLRIKKQVKMPMLNMVKDKRLKQTKL